MTDLNKSQFIGLMARPADAWGALKTEKAVACFSPDAVYIQPPEEQYYAGREQLRAYFGALEPGTFLFFQNIWFNEGQQAGCIEFSFGVRGRSKADHGTAVVQLQDGLIADWREYVVPGPADFKVFTAAAGKDWRWHIGNYPS